MLQAKLKKDRDDRARELERSTAEIKRLEHDLRESELRYRALAENLPTMLSRYDIKKKKYVYWNTDEMWSGWKHEEWNALDPDERRNVVHPDDRAVFEPLYNNWLQSESPDPLRMEYRIQHRDGYYRWIECFYFKEFDTNGNLTARVELSWDSTERKNVWDALFKAHQVLQAQVEERSKELAGVQTTAKSGRRLEDQLIQVKKVDILRALVSGLTHNLKDHFQSIHAHNELALIKIGQKMPIEEHLKAIEQSAASVESLMDMLTVVGQQRVEKFNMVDVGGATDEVVQIVKYLVDPLVEINVDKQPGLQIELHGTGLLQEVLLMLLTNSAEAVSRKGTINVILRKKTLDEEFCKRHREARPGDYLHITIEDTGTGIPADILPRIFEVKFSTKRTAGGVGLGLSNVYSIIKSHNGWIHVQSTLGKGTLFEIHIPMTSSQMMRETTPMAELLPGGTEKILLIEDEFDVRKLGQVILEKFGYHVLPAKSGEKALEIFKEQELEVGLVILDLTLPKMSGLETFNELRKKNHGQRVVVASELSDVDALGEVMSAGAQGFIHKPFRIYQMLRVVRDAIDR